MVRFRASCRQQARSIKQEGNVAVARKLVCGNSDFAKEAQCKGVENFANLPGRCSRCKRNSVLPEAFRAFKWESLGQVLGADEVFEAVDQLKSFDSGIAAWNKHYHDIADEAMDEVEEMGEELVDGD